MAGICGAAGSSDLRSGRRIAIMLLALAAANGSATPAHGQVPAEVHSFHCLYGCPMGAPATNDLVVREIYTLSSDDFTKMADWVAYRITPETIGPSQSRNWQADPWLDPAETLEPTDYDGSSAAIGIDRGHQAPLAAFSGTPFWAETNILSNITPQAKELNEGSWQQLEARETALVKESGKPVYVITGPLFEKLMPPLPKADEIHRVPSGYWKVIATEDGRISAFIFDQATPRNAAYCDRRARLDDVELRARLRLFPRLSSRSALKPLDDALGCS